MKRTYCVQVSFNMLTELLHARLDFEDVVPLNVPPDLDVVGVKQGGQNYALLYFTTEHDLDRYMFDKRVRCVAPFTYQHIDTPTNDSNAKDAGTA